MSKQPIRKLNSDDQRLIALFKYRLVQLRQVLSRLHGINNKLSAQCPGFDDLNIDLPERFAAHEAISEIQEWQRRRELKPHG